MNWNGKPYYSLDAWFKNEYGGKCRKISIDGGFTCPNRDGTLDDRGCIFCSEGGSGDFAIPYDKLHEEIEAIEAAKNADSKKNNEFSCVKRLHSGNHNYIGYVAYFQAFTSTYGKIERLREMYETALSEEKVIGISIGTRPDCLGEEVIDLLEELNNKYKDKFIWIEMGLQTIHESTAIYIRRHYPLSRFEKAVQDLRRINIPFIVHVIIGLPYETEEMMYQTVKYVSELKPFGVKLQLLHVLMNTDLAKEYEEKKFETLTIDGYINIIINCVEMLDKDIVIHRLTGDGDREILISPLWSIQKMTVLNKLHHEMKIRGTVQGGINIGEES